MARTPEELLAEALDLPADARARIAESLISSLDEAADETDPATLEREWLAEVSRRAAEIDRGAVRTIPAAEVFRAAHEELRIIRSRRVSGG